MGWQQLGHSDGDPVDALGPVDDSAFVAGIGQHQSVDDSSEVAKSRLIIRAKGVVDLLNSSIHS